MNRSTALVATIILALLSLTVGAQVYRWVDKDGKVQYSDQPPPPGAGKAEATKINSSSPSPSAAPSAPAKSGDKSAEKGKDAGKVIDASKGNDADKARQAKEREEYCQELKGNLRTLEEGGRIAKNSPSGERTIMSDEEIVAETQRVKGLIADRCK